MKIYICFSYDYEIGWEIFPDDFPPPKAFFSREKADKFAKKYGGDIFEYEIEDSKNFFPTCWELNHHNYILIFSKNLEQRNLNFVYSSKHNLLGDLKCLI